MSQTYRDLTISELFFNNNMDLAAGEIKNYLPENYANGGVTDSWKMAQPTTNIDLAKPIFENSNSGTNTNGFFQKHQMHIIVVVIVFAVIYLSTRQQKKKVILPVPSPDEDKKSITNTN